MIYLEISGKTKKTGGVHTTGVSPKLWVLILKWSNDSDELGVALFSETPKKTTARAAGNDTLLDGGLTQRVLIHVCLAETRSYWGKRKPTL